MTVQFFKHIQIKHRRTQITSYSSLLICSIFPRLFSYIITYHDVISIFLSCINTEARAEKLGFKKKNIKSKQSSTPQKPRKEHPAQGKMQCVCFSAEPRGLKEEHIPTLLPSFSPWVTSRSSQIRTFGKCNPVYSCVLHTGIFHLFFGFFFSLHFMIPVRNAKKKGDLGKKCIY